MLEQLGRTEAPERQLREREVIALVGELVRELHPQRVRFIDVQPSSRIERDLGIDSLGRTELILRIERAFRVRLARPDHWRGGNSRRSDAGAGAGGARARADGSCITNVFVSPVGAGRERSADPCSRCLSGMQRGIRIVST